MAKKKRKRSGVWGIDIGQCALKALRCTAGDDGESVIADAFDYVEYPKILSQPDAEPDELVREALEQFLSRNELRGDKVCMSVSGQAGLSRFFKPPPVETKVIPDIVKYEARQQIPFALEDVIWDYQRIGGQVVEGIVMDSEVGIFAMKRDAVFRALQPFITADVEVDIVQLSPLAVFNVVVYDILNGGPDPDEIDPDRPPESLVILSMGTETTDLVITNGMRVWLRNIPLGGNHFTKQLTKELKLTYAKAEHLKRNARQAEDPKTVFQVMRPVFNDLVTEIQRSMGYFQSIDRQAKIGKMVMLGNATKLPGLRQYLSKNLGHDVIKIDSYSRLSGPSVVESKAFEDSLLSYSVSYGLCLQGLGDANLTTNLLPREFMTERTIRAKKPWAVACVGALMLAAAFNFFFHQDAWWEVNPVRQTADVSWSAAQSAVQRVDTDSQQKVNRDSDQMEQLIHLRSLAQEVAGDRDRKLLWLEVMRAINTSLPRGTDYPPGIILDPEEVPFTKRAELQIDSIETEFFPELGQWFDSSVSDIFQDELKIAKAQGDDVEALESASPSGPGWVVQLTGYHYHNSEESTKERNFGGNYVRNTLMKNLRDGSVTLPDEKGEQIPFTMKELGIGFPVLIEDPEVDKGFEIENVNHPLVLGEVRADDEIETDEPLSFPAPRYDFVLQFCWTETPLTARMVAREANRPISAETSDCGDDCGDECGDDCSPEEDASGEEAVQEAGGGA